MSTVLTKILKVNFLTKCKLCTQFGENEVSSLTLKGYYEDIPQELMEKKINLICGTNDGYLEIIVY